MEDIVRAISPAFGTFWAKADSHSRNTNMTNPMNMY